MLRRYSTLSHKNFLYSLHAQVPFYKTRYEFFDQSDCANLFYEYVKKDICVYFSECTASSDFKYTVFKRNHRFSKVCSLYTIRCHHTKLFVEVQADTSIYTRAEKIFYSPSPLLYVAIYVPPCIYRFVQYMYGTKTLIFT